MKFITIKIMRPLNKLMKIRINIIVLQIKLIYFKETNKE